MRASVKSKASKLHFTEDPLNISMQMVEENQIRSMENADKTESSIP